MNLKDFYKNLNREEVILAYKGRISPDLLRMVLKTTETSLNLAGATVPVRKKVYHILVELVQNLIKHLEPDPESEKNMALLVIFREYDHYIISTGNFIRKHKMVEFKQRIDSVNQMSYDELRDFYRSVMDGVTLSQKGGAGLGLIDIVRKSGEKLQYEIDSHDPNHDFVTLMIRVQDLQTVLHSEI